jgi:hypothetical protein
VPHRLVYEDAALFRTIQAKISFHACGECRKPSLRAMRDHGITLIEIDRRAARYVIEGRRTVVDGPVDDVHVNSARCRRISGPDALQHG